jgi:hypothetical protein
MDHERSSLDCVDPFYPSGSVSGITSKYVSKTTEENFHSNILKSKNFKKITAHKMTSDDYFFYSNHNLFQHKISKKTYDFIYIDGCHEPEFLTKDIENSWKVLSKSGVMWMDDYGFPHAEKGKIKYHIDEVLDKYKTEFEVLHQGYQLAIKKIK